ncbi:MAG: polysaccharide biosynthesis protein [Oscillospiraceae bacterium]|nr:polysaccharide biosynthesis protein [Oscillospiraceae bacterium]
MEFITFIRETLLILFVVNGVFSGLPALIAKAENRNIYIAGGLSLGIGLLVSSLVGYFFSVALGLFAGPVAGFLIALCFIYWDYSYDEELKKVTLKLNSKKSSKRASHTEEKSNFLVGATILSAATLIVKVIGMFYKIPLKAVIGDQGFAYFTAAYDIYTVLLVISTTGLPVAMSRMVSEAHTLGNGKQMQRIFKTALFAFMTIGLLGTGAMMLFPNALADMMKTPKASYSIFALGPAVFFICFASACRGFFQGQGDMRPTAFSQIIEAAGKLFLGLSFAFIVMKLTGSEAYSAGATIAGISVGAGCAALFIFIRRSRNRKYVEDLGGRAISVKATACKLLSIAIPITIGAAGLQLINLLDSMTVIRRLLHASEGDGAIINTILNIARENPSTDQSLAQDGAEIAKGIYSFCQTIFNLPTSLMPCITVSIIPAITAALTRKDHLGVSQVQHSALRVMSLIAAPCAVGLFVLAEPIMSILGGYEGDRLTIAATLLALLAPTILVNSVSTMSTAIMQAHNHMVIPVINTLIGGVLKVCINYVLVGNPNIGILGAPIGTFVCFLVIMSLNLIAMKRVLDDPPKLIPCVWRALLAALIMGVVAYFTYTVLMGLLHSYTICCFAAIAVAGITYLLLVALFKVLTYDDCLLLPKGEKIAKILKIH